MIFKGYKEELVILFGYNIVAPVGRDVNNMIDRQNSSKIFAMNEKIKRGIK